MISIDRNGYLLLLSHCPCDVFDFFNVTEMHGLNLIDCKNHLNNSNQAYIAGWCNFVPGSDKRYVFINLTRCVDDINTFALIHHEMMHLSLFRFDYDMSKEEEMISWTESESKKVFKVVKGLIDV